MNATTSPARLPGFMPNGPNGGVGLNGGGKTDAGGSGGKTGGGLGGGGGGGGADADAAAASSSSTSGAKSPGHNKRRAGTAMAGVGRAP